MSNIILALLVIGLHGCWIYAVATYDWSKFDEDDAADDFLKPYPQGEHYAKSTQSKPNS